MPYTRPYTKKECEYGPGEWPRECSTCAHFIQRNNVPSYCRIQVPEENEVEEEMVCKFHVMKRN